MDYKEQVKKVTGENKRQLLDENNMQGDLDVLFGELTTKLHTRLQKKEPSLWARWWQKLECMRGNHVPSYDQRTNIVDCAYCGTLITDDNGWK